MPIYRGTGGSTPLNDNVTEDEVGLLLSRFDTLASELERQTGVVATDLAQAVTAANQAVTDATQQKLFAQAAAQEASGYAVEAFESKQTAQQQAATATTQATQAIEAKDEAVVSAEAARLSELAADQAREEAVQSSAVAQSQATTATLKAQEALESAQSAADSAQSAITSRIIAAGQANNAVNAANAAEQSATQAATSASEASDSAAQAAASAASVDAANLARIDQSNTFTGPQVVIPDPSDPTNDALLTLQADPDNTEENANPVLRLQQDGDLAQFHVTMSTGTDGELRTVNKETNNVFNDLLFRQEDKAGVIKTPMIIDSNQNVQIVEGALQVKTGQIDTANTNSLALKVNGTQHLSIDDTGVITTNTDLLTSTAQAAMLMNVRGGNAAALRVLNEGTNVFNVGTTGGVTFTDNSELKKEVDGDAIFQVFNTNGGANARALTKYRTVNTTWDVGSSRSGWFEIAKGTEAFFRSYQSGNYTVIGRGAEDSAVRTLAGDSGIVLTQNTHLTGDLTVAGNIVNDGLPTEEKGTWTPVFNATAGGEVGAGIVQRNGEYVKVGTQVTVYFRYNTTSSAAANLTIERLTGLPFPVKDTVDNHAVGSVQTVNIQFGDSDPHLIALNNTSTALIRYNRSNAATTVPTTPSNGGSFTIRGSLTYQTN